MTIKSLLFGSAAILAAVSGARAADAVTIADPEPLAYVRICDTYGAGFYYIPGTETCLKIGGYVRYDIGFGDQVRYGNTVDRNRNGRGDTYYMRARVRAGLDARSETELGTLRSYANIYFNYTRNATGAGAAFNPDAVGSSLAVNDAFIELAGFRAGKTDSLFTTFTNYAGPVIGDDLSVPYGPYSSNAATMQIAYTYTSKSGFSAAVAIEDGGNIYGTYVLTTYAPDVVAGISYKQSWGSVGAVAAYDAVTYAGAFKARLDVNVTKDLTAFLMAGYSTNDPAGIGIGNVNSNNFYAQWNGDYAVWGGGSYKVSDKATIGAQVAYDENENFAVVGNVAYKPVTNLVITPEVRYQTNFAVPGSSPDANNWGGFLRFQRNF